MLEIPQRSAQDSAAAARAVQEKKKEKKEGPSVKRSGRDKHGVLLSFSFSPGAHLADAAAAATTEASTNQLPF